MLFNLRPYYPYYEELHRHIFTVFYIHDYSYQLVYKLCDNNPPFIESDLPKKYVDACTNSRTKAIWYEPVVSFLPQIASIAPIKYRFDHLHFSETKIHWLTPYIYSTRMRTCTTNTWIDSRIHYRKRIDLTSGPIGRYRFWDRVGLKPVYIL